MVDPPLSLARAGDQDTNPGKYGSTVVTGLGEA
jgi:hypothetical protein